MIRYLSSKDILDLVSPPVLIAAIEQGLRDFAGDKVLVPIRQHMDYGGNTLLTMPVMGADAFGAKIVSVVPSNAARGLPITTGLMVVSDSVTGQPLAVLDAAALTAQRTGAIGALGIKHITPHDTNSIGIIGTGVQGAWQAIFACTVRPIQSVYFVARSEEKARRFIDVVSRHVSSVRFCQCADAKELLRKTDAVVAATTSSVPVLPADPALLEGKHFVSIGSFKPSMQEFPSVVYELARQVVVDSGPATLEVGDLIAPLSSGLLHEENVIHLADLVVGKRLVDTDCTTTFKSVGMGLYDLYAAEAILAEAQRRGRGTILDAEADST